MPSAICFASITLPILLLRSHKSASSIVRDLSHVIVIPAAKSGDAPVVVTGVEHDQVDQLAKGEVSPDPEVVVHVYLSDRHPFEVLLFDLAHVRNIHECRKFDQIEERS
jgi:hypothetical protein